MRRCHKTVKLEPKVMAVLAHLASRPGQAVTRPELEAAVWPRRIGGTTPNGR